MDLAEVSEMEFLSRPGGRVAYDVDGAGPLVVLVPGMGDLRAAFRRLAPELAGAGYRVAAMDLRGHGDSDAHFPRYGEVETAGDIAALIEALGGSGPAVIVGSSMAAGAGVVAAVDHAAWVRGLVLLGPFVRDVSGGWIPRLLQQAATAPWWARATWHAYLPSLYAGQKPEDFEAYRARVAASLTRPGYARAFSRTTRTRHVASAARLGRVVAPTLVVMGELDPDFRDAEAEARWVVDHLSHAATTLLMVPEAGHYPHAQRPDIVGPALVEWLRAVCRDG